MLRLDQRLFYDYLRIEESVYEMILEKLDPYIRRGKRLGTNPRFLRTSGPWPLRYFVTGLPMEHLKFPSKISTTGLCGIIPDVSLDTSSCFSLLI